MIKKNTSDHTKKIEIKKLKIKIKLKNQNKTISFLTKKSWVTKLSK